MYVKNLDNPTTDIEFLGLRKTGRYWFPHWVKYLAWSLLITCILVSSFVLIYYGMTFGLIKSYLWMTGIIMTFVLGLVLFTPARICIFVFLDSLFFKLRPMVVRRKIYHSVLSNPENPERKQRVEDFRKYNEHLYKPLHYRQLQPRTDDIKYHIEMRNLTVEVVAHFIFIFLLIYVVLFSVPYYGYNTSNVIRNMVVKANYTRSIPLYYVTTIKTFIEYLNVTLLPALLQNFRVFYNIPGNDSDIYERGWTMDPAVKLIGVPRLRQLRADKVHCLEHENVKGRNPSCAEGLHIYNVETGNFTLEWNLAPALGLTENQVRPWIYQDGWESVTVRTVGKFSTYPAGGYILNFARNIDDSRLILKFMVEFKWIDARTRAVFIEFTTYCVNTNTFNVVTLLAEKTATGYFVTNSFIQPCKFTFNLGELETIYIIMTGCFALLLFIFLCREGMRIRRASFRTYFKKPFAVLDLTVVLLGAIIIVFIILQSYYVVQLVAQLDHSNNNKFVSFAYAAYWSKVGITLEAAVVVLAGLKLFRLLTYRVLFYQLQMALGHSWQNFFNLVLQTFTILIAFSCFFYLMLIAYSHHFSSMAYSTSTIISLTVALDTDFDYKVFKGGFWFVSVMYYLMFIILITLLVMNLYVVIVCLYFHEVKKVPLINKYSILKYLKYLITRNEKSDIYTLAYDDLMGKKKKRSQEDYEFEGLPMRLRGGGNRKSKVRKVRKESKKSKKQREKEEYRLEKEKMKLQKEYEQFVLEIVYLNNFVQRKQYDVTRYIALPLERIIAMKHITIDFLSLNEEQKARSREIAIKALYLYAGYPSTEFDRDKFCIVIVGTHEYPIREYVFTPMKRFIEELGLKRNWVTDDSMDDFDFTNLKKQLEYLDKSLSLIIEKMGKRCEKKKKT